ncbi:MAG: carboxypeptidase-like regulatory domain-containing protein [Flavobacteriaceae bacterium]|jgi:hypothetical protein|nr:carboxypeptidase-like regulatory domain-containing protein [Flavobacteriaceae bacterium]
MKKLLYISFLLVAGFAFGQETKTIIGVVIGNDDYIPLPFATIQVKQKRKDAPKRETKTDFDGKFTIEVKKGEILEIHFTAFYSEQITISDQNEYKIELSPNDGSRDKKLQRHYRRMVRKNGGSYSIPD